LTFFASSLPSRSLACSAKSSPSKSLFFSAIQDSKESNNLSDGLLLIGQMLSDMGSDISVRSHVKQTPRTWGFDTGSDAIVQSHPVGLFDMASDRIVRSHVGQTCRTGLSDIASDEDVRCHVKQAHRIGLFWRCGPQQGALKPFCNS
jgi:hypothetical protein